MNKIQMEHLLYEIRQIKKHREQIDKYLEDIEDVLDHESSKLPAVEVTEF